MLILSSISRGLEPWSVNYISIYENSESEVFVNIKFLSKIFNNWSKDLVGTNVYKTLKFW